MTDAEIKQLSLITLGYKSDQVDANTTAILTAEYDMIYKKALQTHQWNFAKKYQFVTNPVTITNNPFFKYEYTLPNDCEQVRALYFNNRNLKDKWEVICNKLYCDINEPIGGTNLILEYTYKVSAADLPSYYIYWFKYFLAKELCYVLIGARDRLQDISQLENQAFIDARIDDSNSSDIKAGVVNPMIDMGFDF